MLQSVIWTCSHKPVFEANENWSYEEDWKENLTYKNYMPLWFGILDESSTQTNLYEKSVVSSKIFDSIISSLFLILEKLDLRTKKRLFHKENGEDEEFHFCDPNIDLCPTKPRDFHIFFNVVDFYKDIFKSNYNREYFSKWMEKYCLLMMRYYNENPLISGFLKLFECAFNSGEFFSCAESLEYELSYFLKNILQKSQNFHGDIQKSCIELILKYPVKFYKSYITDLVKVFEAAFELGKSDSWMARLTIDSVIKLYTFYEDSTVDLKYFCENVFPLLNSFLENQQEDHNILLKKRLKKEKIKQAVDSNLLIVQKKIISFLGKLDQDTAALIISKPNENLTKWSSKQILEITLKFGDIEPSIYLDSLLPKMCQLSILSADRQTKVACCEFIHSYTIYIIGRRYTMGLQWEELCRTVLILGSDNDITIQEMFKPLLSQIMHYLSKRENINTEGVEILLNCLMEGISNVSNDSIRDLSAICLREFVEWSLKHTSAELLNSSPASIKGRFFYF